MVGVRNMDITKLITLGSLPMMMLLGAFALWMVQKRPAKVLAVAAAINDVVAEGLKLPVTVIYLEADGGLRGITMQIQRLHGRRRSGDVMLTGFDAFDERHGRANLFDFSRVLTMVDASSGDLVISPATFCTERAGLGARPTPTGFKVLAS